MKTTLEIIPVAGKVTWREIEFENDQPSYDELRPILDEFFPDLSAEHVSVLCNGKRTDMFVDETGHLKSLPINIRATAVYWEATMQAEGNKFSPRALTAIVGPAILFHDRVWF